MDLPGDRQTWVIAGVVVGGLLVAVLTVGVLTPTGDVDGDGLTVAEELDAGTEITTADTDRNGARFASFTEDC